MTNFTIPVFDTSGNIKSFDVSPWGSMEGFLEASKAGAAGNASALTRVVPDLYHARDLTGIAVATLPFEIVDDNENIIDSSADWQNTLGGIPDPRKFLYNIATSLCGGAAYAIPDVTPKPYIYDIQYCAPHTITAQINRDGLQWFDRATDQGKTERLDPKQILHFWLPDPDVEIGPALSHPMGVASQAAQLTLNMATTMNTIAKRGFVPPTLLAVTGGITPADREKTEAWYNRWFRDPLGQIAKLVHAEKMDIKQLGAGMEQLKGAYVELKREASEDIYKPFGIPFALAASDNAFASEFNALIRLWYSSSFFVNVYSTIQEVVTTQLLKPTFGYYWRFNPDALDAFQDDEATRATAMQQLTGAVDKSPKVARFVMDFLGYDFSEEQEKQLDELVTDKEAQAQQNMQMQQDALAAKQPQDKPSDMPMENKPMMQGKSITLTAPMVKDLKTWSDMALRWYKKGKGKAEDFECKALPDDIANGIRAKLKAATNEGEVVKAFEISESVNEVVVDNRYEEIKALADAINNAAEKAVQQPNNITINTPPITLTAQMPEQGTVTVNVPQQPAPTVTVNVPEQKTPIVNVNPVNNIEVKPADVIIDKASQKQVNIQVNHDRSGKITDAKGTIQEK